MNLHLDHDDVTLSIAWQEAARLRRILAERQAES